MRRPGPDRETSRGERSESERTEADAPTAGSSEEKPRRWLSRSSRHRRRKRLAGFELLHHQRRRKTLMTVAWFAVLAVVGMAVALLIPSR
jgi:hypothetical protein